MDILETFIVVLIELSTLFILWSNFRFREKNNIKINLLIVLIGASILAFDMHLIYIAIFTYLSIIFLVNYFYKISLIKIIFDFVVFAVTLSIGQMITVKVLDFMGIYYANTFSYNLTISIIELLFVVIVCHYGVHNKISHIFRLNSKIVYCFIVNLGAYFIISKLIWNYSKDLILNNLVIYTVSSIGVFLLNMLLYWYIAKITEEKKTLEIQKQYEPILAEIIEEIRRKQHDFKNYLNTINGIVGVSSEKELKNKLDDYIKSLNVTYKELEDIVYIDNVIIRAVVYTKLCEAERLNIKFIYSVDDKSLQHILNDNEVSDILHNLINNAFEAVLNQNDKTVILNIFSQENTTIIEVKNSGITIKSEDVVNIFNRGFSTKGKNRGYGLYNIKKTVEHNGGKIQLFFDDEYTILRITFLR